MSTAPETRRAIAQRAIDRATTNGVPIDTDPTFLTLLEEWIRGDIDIKAMRERYIDMIALRTAERRGPLESLLGIHPSESPNEANEE